MKIICSTCEKVFEIQDSFYAKTRDDPDMCGDCKEERYQEYLKTLVDVELTISLVGVQPDLVDILEEQIYECGLESMGDVDVFKNCKVDVGEPEPTVYTGEL